MTRYISSILTTILDTDAYKLHMQQAVFHRYRNVTVSSEFRCRGNDLLGMYANKIFTEIEHMQQLSLSEEEYIYLSGLPFFKQDYLDWLMRFRYDPDQIKVYNYNGKLDIHISGLWCEVIMWEVPLLALISELVHRHRSPEIIPEIAVEYLLHKIDNFKRITEDIDLTDFRVMDFGTRRRFSRDVQLAIVSTLQKDFPWLTGSSNYDIARRFDIKPVGTQAHEWFQAHQQISPVLANSQREALQVWLDEYNGKLGIAITDCITMDAFLRDFDFDLANHYQGLRHDSGDPIVWGEKALSHYEKLAIDPHSKTLVFSDNLNFNKAIDLYRHFNQRINVMFGIGTYLTCDIPQVKPLNIVIKLVECNGKPVAKLSDSPGKTICQNKDFIRALCKAFDLPLYRKNQIMHSYQDIFFHMLACKICLLQNSILSFIIQYLIDKIKFILKFLYFNNVLLVSI